MMQIPLDARRLVEPSPDFELFDHVLMDNMPFPFDAGQLVRNVVPWVDPDIFFSGSELGVETDLGDDNWDEADIALITAHRKDPVG